MQGPSGVVRRARNLAAFAFGGTRPFARAVLAGLIGRPVDLLQPAVGIRIVRLEGQRFPGRTGKLIRLRIIGKTLDEGFVLAEDGDPRGNTLLLEQRVIHPVGVARIGQHSQ